MARRKCKKCNGEVIYKKYARFTYTLVFFLAGGCMMWIPFIGWLGAPICFMLALLSLVCPVRYYTECKDCGAIEMLTKKEYEEAVK